MVVYKNSIVDKISRHETRVKEGFRENIDLYFTKLNFGERNNYNGKF